MDPLAGLRSEEVSDDAPHSEAPVVPVPPATETSVVVGGTPGAVSGASGSPPLVSAEVVEVYKEVEPYGGSRDFASQLMTACREKDPSCTPTQVAEVVWSHYADIRGADNAIAWILGQVPRFFVGGYQRPGDAPREFLEGHIRVLHRLQK